MTINPICFMVMPYGTKPVLDRGDPSIPAEINFDRLWEAALRPAIQAMGYEAVRADQDLGAMVIKDMIERLAISDLVIADVTIGNANVYYEVGIRHVAKVQGCVLVAADWAKPQFDMSQMRQVRYPLPSTAIDDATAAKIQETLTTMVPNVSEGASPFYQALPGYPDHLDPRHATSFTTLLRALAAFQGKVAGVRAAPRQQRAARALRLRDEYFRSGPMERTVAVELLYLLRDFAEATTTLEFIEMLPVDLRLLPLVLEQKALVQSQAGHDVDAIATLEALIQLDGETAERRGLVGGRYKRLHVLASDPEDKHRFLNLAIENYDTGMHLDLNDYYAASNLPRLYQLRNLPGDADRARVAAAVTLVSCQRSRARNPADEWIKPTLLAAAFDSGDVEAARQLALEMRAEGPAGWKLRGVIGDLELALQLHDVAHAAALRPILETLQAIAHAT